MAKESEQKFLVRGDGWRSAAGPGKAVEQFYLAEGEGRSARVRISDGTSARLALKFGTAARVRDEFEYDLPLADAREMRAFALGNIVAKTRYVVRHGGRDWEIDVFSGPLAGLVMAEIESEEEVVAGELPDWVGAEVTGIAGYYNLSLALHGLPEEVV